MPVQRFRTAEAARAALWLSDGDLARRIRDLWQFCDHLVPSGGTRFRGVRKFHTLEEANAEREERTRQRVRELRGRIRRT